MKFPFIIERINKKHLSHWQERFGVNEDWDWSIRENIWRRTQAKENKVQSGWQPGAMRRRLLHFRDKYAICGNSFCLSQAYLFLNIKNTKDEIDAYEARIQDCLKGWRYDEGAYTLGNLVCYYERKPVNDYDIMYNWPVSGNYNDLSLYLHSDNFTPGVGLMHKPWHVLKTTGIRRVAKRGQPQYIEAETAADFLPAQVEIGCGPSIESGIPPLNYLHGIYGVYDKKRQFIFTASEDTALQFLSQPEEQYRHAAFMHFRCLDAQVGRFYLMLKEMIDAGHVVWKVVNNNFDNLLVSAGIDHIPMRLFDNIGSYPAIDFDPCARSLMVFGSHADRRTAQAQARSKGLPIIFVDPEGYWRGTEFVIYPLESPQSQDMVIKQPATLTMQQLVQIMGM